MNKVDKIVVNNKLKFQFQFKKIQPVRPFSWQACILLSLFSWLLALLSRLLIPPANYAYHLTSNGGLLFFILGTIWWQLERPWKFLGINWGPWIIGLLLAILFFEDLSIPARDNIIICSTPIFAAGIAALPRFFRGEIAPTVPPPSVWQELIVLFLCHLLISCWLQLAFLLNHWVDAYPSLLDEEFGNSAFVVRVGIQSPPSNRGERILNTMEAYLKSQLDGQQWERIEQIIASLQENRLSIDEQVKQRLPDKSENQLWQLRGDLIQNQTGYVLKLYVSWQGMTGGTEKYYLQKSCRIFQTYGQPTPGSDRLSTDAIARGEFRCQSASDRQPGEPSLGRQWFD